MDRDSEAFRKGLVDALMGARGPVLDKYYHALGQFIAGFAKTEAIVQEVLAHVAGLDKETALALLSGVKVDAAKGLINRIYEVKPPPEATKAEIDLIFTQLGLINKMRNDLVHYGATFGDGLEMFVTNKRGILPTRQAQSSLVSEKILHEMTFDLLTITERLILLSFGHLMPPETRQLFGKARDVPWRYKPQPIPPQDKGAESS